jgi:hypothetical protein
LPELLDANQGGFANRLRRLGKDDTDQPIEAPSYLDTQPGGAGLMPLRRSLNPSDIAMIGKQLEGLRLLGVLRINGFKVNQPFTSEHPRLDLARDELETGERVGWFAAVLARHGNLQHWWMDEHIVPSPKPQVKNNQHKTFRGF